MQTPRIRFTTRGMMAAVAVAAAVSGAIAFLMQIDGAGAPAVALLAWPLLGLGLVFAINVGTRTPRG